VSIAPVDNKKLIENISQVNWISIIGC
jgi:hypothetical protein